MFRNVPGCSGMFHVPGFVDALIIQSLLNFADGNKYTNLSKRAKNFRQDYFSLFR